MSDEWVVTMPKLGETVTEGTLGNWLKQAGDEVAFDDPLFEVSTDKVDSEIPSPYDGVIVEILVPAGETVPVGTPLVRIGPPGAQPVHAGVNAPAAATGATAAAGGPSLASPAAPHHGRLRGHGRRGPGLRRADRRGARHHHAQAGRDGHRGHHRHLAEERRRHRRVRRPAVRGVHRQGRLGDPQPVRRGAAGDPGRGRARPSPVGTVLARIGEPGRAPAAQRPRRPRRRRARRPPPPAPAPAATGSAEPVDRNGRVLSPLVRRLVAENGLDVAAIAGHRRRWPDPPGGRRAGHRRRRRPAPPRRRAGARRRAGRSGRRPPRPRPGRAAAAAGRRGRVRRRPTRATRSCSCPGCGWPWPPG